MFESRLLSQTAFLRGLSGQCKTSATSYTLLGKFLGKFLGKP